MAFFFIPLQSVIFSGLPPDQMPAASGVSNFARICAGAIGTSLFTTLWDRRAALHHAQLSEAAHAGTVGLQSALEGLQAGGLTLAQAQAAVERQLLTQAYTMAVTDLFLLSSALFVGLIALVWLARLPRRPV